MEAEHVLWNRGARSARTWYGPAARCGPSSPPPQTRSRAPQPGQGHGGRCAALLPSGAKLNWVSGYFCNFLHLPQDWGPWGDVDGTRQATILTPGYTSTDVFPPRFTVRPSLRISRFRPRAPGSPPAGRGARWLRRQGREKLGGEVGRDQAEGGRSAGRGDALTVETVGPEGAAFGQYGQQSLLAEKQLADDTIAAPEAAAAPRPQSQLKAAQDDRVPAKPGAQRSPTGLVPRPCPQPARRLTCSPESQGR